MDNCELRGAYFIYRRPFANRRERAQSAVFTTISRQSYIRLTNPPRGGARRREAPRAKRALRKAHKLFSSGHKGAGKNSVDLSEWSGWGARIRTWECRYQKPMPYHLATPQRPGPHEAGSGRDSAFPLRLQWAPGRKSPAKSSLKGGARRIPGKRCGAPAGRPPPRTPNPHCTRNYPSL